MDDPAISKLLGSHRLTLVKRSSPVLLTATWQDSRSASGVVKRLRQDRAVCMAEPDQSYRALSPQTGG
ncbi:MAG: hypothetical protein D6698_05945 [Gammaproteobacteria bacterium]|nr:MAG: hypothetical protein D6698_05945 [Gammaproteobacteria bacterium]